MKKNRILVFLGVWSLFLINAQLLSQSVIAASGQTAEVNGYSLSYTLGEIAIQSFELSNGMFTEGFHQPNLIVQKMAVERSDDNQQSAVRVYPNPTPDILVIEFDSEIESTSHLTLSTLNERVLEVRELEAIQNKYQWNLSAYPTGTYVLTIQNEGAQILSTFRIMKIN